MQVWGTKIAPIILLRTLLGVDMSVPGKAMTCVRWRLKRFSLPHHDFQKKKNLYQNINTIYFERNFIAVLFWDPQHHERLLGTIVTTKVMPCHDF